MRKTLEKAKVSKKSIDTDIVIDSLNGTSKESFLIFAELTYQSEFNERYDRGIPKRIHYLIRKAEEGAKTLTSAFDEDVCKSAHVCVISDDLVSIDGAMDLMEKLEDRYPEINFLSDGLIQEEKYRIFGSKYYNTDRRGNA